MDPLNTYPTSQALGTSAPVNAAPVKPQPAPAPATAFLEIFQMMSQMSATNALGSFPEDGSQSDTGSSSTLFGDPGMMLMMLLPLLTNLAGFGAQASSSEQQPLSVSQTAASAGAIGQLNAPVSSADGEAPSFDKLANTRSVVNVAEQVGADPTLAVAMMLVESGGNNKAVGDNGTSFGLFQLHEGGMLTSAGLTPSQAYDPSTNARVSLTSLKKTHDMYPKLSPGDLAARSQRPADASGYAVKIEANMSVARDLIAQSRA